MCEKCFATKQYLDRHFFFLQKHTDTLKKVNVSGHCTLWQFSIERRVCPAQFIHLVDENHVERQRFCY